MSSANNSCSSREQPIKFTGRHYLGKVLASTAKRLVLRCSRQVEKTTLLVNRILYDAVMNPGVQLLLVCPPVPEQASTFSKSRLIPADEESPLIRRLLMGRTKRRLPVMHCRFANGSQLFVRSAFHSADAVRGVSADVLFVDEFQDIAAGDLAVLQETLSHSERSQIVLTGTPKLIDNHLEAVFRQSTACEWLVQCPGCKRPTRLDEHVLDPRGLHAPGVPSSSSTRTAGSGSLAIQTPFGETAFRSIISWCPGLTLTRIFVRQTAYDPARFRNECLGLPCTLGDHQITREEIEACCGDRRMANTKRRADRGPPSAHRRDRLGRWDDERDGFGHWLYASGFAFARRADGTLSSSGRPK